jgi:hypothetical protein
MEKSGNTQNFHTKFEHIDTLGQKLGESHNIVAPNVAENIESCVNTMLDDLLPLALESLSGLLSFYEIKRKTKEELERFSTLLLLSSAVGVEWGHGNITRDDVGRFLIILNEYFVMYLLNLYLYIMTKSEYDTPTVNEIVNDGSTIKDINSLVNKLSTDMANNGYKYSSSVKITKTGFPQKSPFLRYLIDLQNLKSNDSS